MKKIKLVIILIILASLILIAGSIILFVNINKKPQTIDKNYNIEQNSNPLSEKNDINEVENPSNAMQNYLPENKELKIPNI